MKVKQTMPVEGDWFVVQNAEDRWHIHRVVLWMFMEATDSTVEHVRACTEDGMPHDDYGDTWFVLGRDKAPNGQTWQEIYDATVPSSVLVREINVDLDPHLVEA